MRKQLSEPYLEWIRSLPCLVAPDRRSPCSGKITAHHVAQLGASAQARWNDFRAVPLCSGHHMAGFGPDAVHGIGRRAFEARFRVEFETWIVRLNRAWGMLKAAS